MLMTIKGLNSVVNLHKLTCNNPKLELVKGKASVKFHRFVHMIPSGNEILTITKGHICVVCLGKWTHNIPNPDLVNINADAKFGLIASICAQDIEQKCNNSDKNQGP